MLRIIQLFLGVIRHLSLKVNHLVSQVIGKMQLLDVRQLSGKSGYLHTGHCLIDLKQGIELSERSTAKVEFAQMSNAEILDYVDSGEPLNVAGGFTLDGLSAPFITNIEGDPSGIIGLSLPLLRKMIITLGYSWPDLKNK